jgi:hypothetical protein
LLRSARLPLPDRTTTTIFLRLGSRGGCAGAAQTGIIALNSPVGSIVLRGRITRRIEALDPQRDYRQIVFLLTAYVFPWDIERALEFALFRTYAVPSISGLLYKTREFVRRPRKRYDDTELILAEILENGFDSQRGQAALRRMNAMHGRFPIANADFLYVLSTFVFEPIRWIDRFGWRPLTMPEKLAMFHYYRELGRRMHIENIPAGFADCERYNLDYEREPPATAQCHPKNATFCLTEVPKQTFTSGCSRSLTRCYVKLHIAAYCRTPLPQSRHPVGWRVRGRPSRWPRRPCSGRRGRRCGTTAAVFVMQGTSQHPRAGRRARLQLSVRCDRIGQSHLV